MGEAPLLAFGMPTPSGSLVVTGQTPSALPVGGDNPPENYKIAVIADTDDGSAFQNVLDLIARNNADIVLHQGDMAYTNGGISTAWASKIDNTLGTTFPYVFSDGNHDSFSGYTNFLQARLDAMGVGVTVNKPNYAFTFKNIRYVMSQSDSGGNPTHITNSFAGDPHIWRFTSWHKNQNAMQVGGKGNAVGWPTYENARIAGAILLTGHEHSYSRTKTLSNMQNQTIVLDDATKVTVKPGESFCVVSGIGGNSLRNQDICLPATPPYGCSYWASIFTTDSSPSVKFGALFITVHVNGNARLGKGELIQIDDVVRETFDIELN